jgi:hypothetical protein
VIDGKQVAKGGFSLERYATMSPKKGPIGTMITITYHGLASTLYGGSGAVYYDGHYTGAATGIWTRGSSTVKIRASGPVGGHIIQATGGIGNNYLNIAQSPIPWVVDQVFRFKVTADHGAPANRIDWPAKITPTISQRTTLGSVGLNYSSGVTARSARRAARSAARRASRPGPEAGRRPARLGDRRRQPRQLHRHVLELRRRSRSATEPSRRRNARRDAVHGAGQPRRLALLQLVQSGETWRRSRSTSSARSSGSHGCGSRPASTSRST